MGATDLEARLSAVGSLADPTRRRLYLHAIACPEGTSREAAASATGVSRPLAAFHLDKLVENGLLVVRYRRLTGRTGPGAGRPAKIYSRSGREVSLAIPPRSFELLARLLLEALGSALGRDSEPAVDPERALDASAEAAGTLLGVEAVRRAGPGASDGSLVEAAATVLDESGFEPRPDDCGGLVLGNCPFRPLSGQYMDMICGANLAMVQGMAEALGVPGCEAVLDRDKVAGGACCVTLRTGRSVPPPAGAIGSGSIGSGSTVT